MRDLKTTSSVRLRTFAALPFSVQERLTGVNAFLPFLHANLELPTILSIGMLLQILAFTFLPRYIAAAPAVVFLIYKMLYARPQTIADNWNLNGARLGRYSASVPSVDGSLPEKAGANGVVCFVLGSQSNHPLGVFAPGFQKVAEYYGKMFREAESNPEKWGFLSRTTNLSSQAPNRGNFFVTLSYWRSLDHLRNFAAHSVHAEGMKWWHRTHAELPHVGIFHETFVCAPGHYETIYENMHPFGMGQIRSRPGEDGEKGALHKADGRAWRSMDVRMGREV